MHITLETDYAIRITDYLAKCKCRASAQEIAEQTNVTIRFSLKILSKLVKSGILVSFKGVNGGYEFNHAAEDISLNDILEAIEGEYNFSRCLMDGSPCTANTNKDVCNYHCFFAGLSLDIRERLKAATLDKFIKVQ